MPNISPGIRITGSKEARTRAGNIKPAALRRLRAVAQERADQSVARYRSEMLSEYTSPWSHGSIARSIKAKVTNQQNGVSVSFSAIGGERNHIQYITGVLPDSYFRDFPVTPFPIVPVFSKLLRIRFPGQVRKFIQNPTTGRMEGSEKGRILAKKVLWGSRTGGFRRDVIRDVTEAEGQVFVEDVQAAVTQAISENTD